MEEWKRDRCMHLISLDFLRVRQPTGVLRCGVVRNYDRESVEYETDLSIKPSCPQWHSAYATSVTQLNCVETWRWETRVQTQEMKATRHYSEFSAMTSKFRRLNSKVNFSRKTSTWSIDCVTIDVMLRNIPIWKQNQERKATYSSKIRHFKLNCMIIIRK